MTLLPAIRRHRHSAPLLSVVLVAWLGIVAAPCAMAWNGSVSEQSTESLIETHDNCPSAKNDAPIAAPQRPPTHQTSPPVYLTTQRFRI